LRPHERRVITEAMNLITDYMQEAGLTQWEMARKVGVSQAAVHQWMRGICKPSPVHALKIEAVTEGKITRYQLCPEVFGGEQ